jgi:hypothetical protein
MMINYSYYLFRVVNKYPGGEVKPKLMAFLLGKKKGGHRR